MRPALLAACLVLTDWAPAFAARERTGQVDAFVVLDESGSMRAIFPRVTAFIAEALVRDYLEPGDYLCIVGFSDLPRVRVSQQVSSIAEKANLEDLVRNLNVRPEGHTDMGRALEEALRQVQALGHPSHQQLLLFVTDGLNQPPRDSPYYSPAAPDRGGPIAPPSSFNKAFLDRARQVASTGHRLHVVGIGTVTDARRLAEALGAPYTILDAFSVAELREALAGFWDETISLESLKLDRRSVAPGESLALDVRLRSSLARDQEVTLGGVRVASIESLGLAPTPDPQALVAAPAARTWALRAGQSAAFEVALTVAEGFPAGDFRVRLHFEQETAARFYPPDGEVSFHVTSFWERHGATLLAGSVGLALGVLGLLWRRRRPLAITLGAEGADAETTVPAVRVAIGGSYSVGGGAVDRFQIPGLPPRAALLERRGVSRFALVSERPEWIPTVADYALGTPVPLRGEAAGEARAVRFVLAKRRRRRPPSATRARVRPVRPPDEVDFR